VRIVLYTDQPILAEALTAILAESGMTLDSILTSLPVLLLCAEQEIKPDVILMDLTEQVTFEMLSDIRRAAPLSKIVLWAHTISTELAFQAIGLGVRGILRTTQPTELVAKCVAKVYEGELWFEKALTDEFLMARRVAVSQREGQLIALLVGGMKNKEIAWELGISEGTVKVYLSRLFQKLAVKDRFELALYGLKNTTAGHGQPNHSHLLGNRRATVTGVRSMVMARKVV
jgi:two-component system, NarL family, nitrate/nitrite response regulator NarL